MSGILYLYPYDGRMDSKALDAAMADRATLWSHIQREAARAGYEVRHINEVTESSRGAVLAMNHPRKVDVTGLGSGPRICLNFEPPATDARPWAWPRAIMRDYSHVYSAYRPSAILPARTHLPPWSGWARRTGLFHYPQAPQISSRSVFAVPRSRLAVLVNANKKALVPYRELYSRRVRTMLAFSPEELTLHGLGWDRPVKTGKFGTVERYWRGPVSEKTQAMQSHSFAITYENMDVEGYVTEKIFDAMACGAVPVYLGAKDIAQLVPRHCFVDARMYSSDSELAAHVRAMPKSEIQEYRWRIWDYMHSDAYQLLAPSAFGENIRHLLQTGRSATWVDAVDKPKMGESP